jgi:hypothetical protein
MKFISYTIIRMSGEYKNVGLPHDNLGLTQLEKKAARESIISNKLPAVLSTRSS